MPFLSHFRPYVCHEPSCGKSFIQVGLHFIKFILNKIIIFILYILEIGPESAFENTFW
jgi:hypothetical protein